MENLAQDSLESTLEMPREQDLFDFFRVLPLLPVAAYTCDAEGQITAYNNRAAALWGCSPKLRDPHHLYCGSLQLFDTDGSPIRHDRCWMALALRMNQSYNGHEIVIERPDGSRRIATAHAHPFHDEQGNVTGAMNVLIDITEQKQAQEQLRNSQIQLKENDRQKSTLSLVKGLVEMHEGRIEARSEGPGEGSEFTVDLPIAVPEPLPEEITQAVCSPPPVLPQRILVVDDQVVVARSIACLLEAMGHDVNEVYDGEDALEVMVKFRHDVILCDIAMPKIDGYEFARRVRSQSWGRDVPLIACSDNGLREHIKKSLEAGFDHHLVKPLKLDALMSVLEELQQESAQHRPWRAIPSSQSPLGSLRNSRMFRE